MIVVGSGGGDGGSAGTLSVGEQSQVVGLTKVELVAVGERLEVVGADSVLRGRSADGVVDESVAEDGRLCRLRQR